MKKSIQPVFLAFVMLTVLLSGCAPASTPVPPTYTPLPTSVPGLQQLRIMNSGNTDIAGLVVLFPGPTSEAKATRVEFGSIPAGQTTEYREVPSGVYRYAAYEYTLDGHLVIQFVMDWLGENPMAGKKFTYQIVLDPKKVEGNQVNLLTVLVDKP